MIAGLWTILFISALGELSLAGAFATWYWTYDKVNVPFYVMTMSATRSVYYHSGTAAFGAILVTICRMINLLVDRFSEFDYIKCFTTFVDGILKRFNRNAYIMCAVHGNGLCASGLSAYQLILRNVFRYIATDVVIGIVFGFCKVFIVCLTGIGGWSYFMDYYNIIPMFPFFVLVVGAYLIASAFFSVYAMAVDTLVLCARKWCISVIFPMEFWIFRRIFFSILCKF